MDMNTDVRVFLFRQNIAHEQGLTCVCRTPPADFIVYAIIKAYSHDGTRGCFASNEYIARSARVNPKQASRIVTKLVALKLVERIGSNQDRKLRTIRRDMGVAERDSSGESRLSLPGISAYPSQGQARLSLPGTSAYPSQGYHNKK